MKLLIINQLTMKKNLIIIFSVIILSCGQTSEKKDNNIGIIQNDDQKSLIVQKLADSYLKGNFDIARDYFLPDGKHYFNDLEYDVDGIVEGYNFHSVLFENIKHNDRKIYTGYMDDGTIQTFHDFNWSAKSIISGKEYNYPCHCRWEWESDKISKTSCYVDPTGIFAEVALYQEKNK